jgi:hypothetical protein
MADCARKMELLGNVSCRIVAGSKPNGVRIVEWIYECRNCKSKFQHSETNSAILSHPNPLKLNFPPDTIDFECPLCGYAGRYQISALAISSTGSSETS